MFSHVFTFQSQKKGQQSQFLQSRNLKCIALCEGKLKTLENIFSHGHSVTGCKSVRPLVPLLVVFRWETSARRTSPGL